MAKSKPATVSAPPAAPPMPASPPADPPSQIPAVTPARVLIATLGIGSTPAAEIVAGLDDGSRDELVRIYTGGEADKPAKIRELLAAMG